MYRTLLSKMVDGGSDPDPTFVAEFEAAASKLEGAAVFTRIERLRSQLLLRWCRMILSYSGLEKPSPFVLDLDFIKAAEAFAKCVRSMTAYSKSCEGDVAAIEEGWSSV